MPWAVSGRRKALRLPRRPVAPAIVFEHQVEFPRLGKRAQALGIGAEHGGGILDHGQRDGLALPLQLVGVLGAEIKELQRLLPPILFTFGAAGFAGNKDSLAMIFQPTALHLVVPVAFFRLAAIDHVIMEQVVVPGDLPDLRVHDDRAVQAHHFVGRRGAGGDNQLVVTGDHVPPPGLADVPLQFHAHRPVVPKALQSAVYLARLEEKSAPLAQGDQLVHFHGCNPKSISIVSNR